MPNRPRSELVDTLSVTYGLLRSVPSGRTTITFPEFFSVTKILSRTKAKAVGLSSPDATRTRLNPAGGAALAACAATIPRRRPPTREWDSFSTLRRTRLIVSHPVFPTRAGANPVTSRRQRRGLRDARSLARRPDRRASLPPRISRSRPSRSAVWKPRRASAGGWYSPRVSIHRRAPRNRRQQ